MHGAPLPPVAILAGGLATRLRPITETIPKSMVEVGGEPFVAHQLRQLRKEGAQKVVLCVGHHAQPIKDFVKDGVAFGLQVEYSEDGDILLGTGGALKKALTRLGESFVVLYGDSYLPTTFAPIADAFYASGKAALMAVFHNEGSWDQSNVVFENGEILVYDKKNKTPSMTYIDYGLGFFRAAAFDAYADRAAFDLADVYRKLLEAGQLAGHEVHERFYEIGSHKGLRETDEFIRNRRK